MFLRYTCILGFFLGYLIHPLCAQPTEDADHIERQARLMTNPFGVMPIADETDDEESEEESKGQEIDTALPLNVLPLLEEQSPNVIAFKGILNAHVALSQVCMVWDLGSTLFYSFICHNVFNGLSAPLGAKIMSVFPPLLNAGMMVQTATVMKKIKNFFQYLTIIPPATISQIDSRQAQAEVTQQFDEYVTKERSFITSLVTWRQRENLISGLLTAGTFIGSNVWGACDCWAETPLWFLCPLVRSLLSSQSVWNWWTRNRIQSSNSDMR